MERDKMSWSDGVHQNGRDCITVCVQMSFRGFNSVFLARGRPTVPSLLPVCMLRYGNQNLIWLDIVTKFRLALMGWVN